MRAHLLVALGLLVAASIRAQVTPPLSSDELERHLRERIRAWVEEFHASPAHVDEDDLARRGREIHAQGRPPSAVLRWLENELASSRYAFAPVGARHAGSTRYRLPFDGEMPIFLVQGVGGQPTHVGSNRYAFDFAMRRGTPVLAARQGRVARVYDGFTEGRLDDSMEHKANSVFVLHDDGTFAGYVHLEPGIPVREGRRIAAGDVIGRSGDTGRSRAPHLHFFVLKRQRDGGATSIPIRFDDGTPRGYVPQAAQYYGDPPQPNVRLRAYLDGRLVKMKDRVRIARGATAQLRIEKIGADGEAVDVTRHPRTRYESMTLWSMDVDGKGRVVVAPAPGFERVQTEDRGGMIGVLFGSREDTERGLTRIVFDIGD